VTVVVEEQQVTEKSEVTERDVLLRAADLLEEFGWRQESYGSKEEGRMCAMGAIYEAAIDFKMDVAYEAETCLARHVGWSHVASWNDAPERTKAEVVAALRLAAQ
jgi:hypothetical protein